MQQLHLSIPEPCHEDWQQMTPSAQGRFCNACAKQVIDFSNMSDEQVLNYFSTIKNEKVCGRAYPDQLERVITMPKAPKKKIAWYWNYITMLLLFFSKTNSVKAQLGKIAIHPVKIDSTIQTVAINKRSVPVPSTPVRIIMGNVSSSSHRNRSMLYVIDGVPYPKGLPDNFDSKNITDISILKAGEAAALFGIEGVAGAIVITTNAKVEVPQYKQLDSVIITSYPSHGCPSTMMMGGVKAIKIQSQSTFKDSVKILATKITGALKIYPNPVKKGTAFTIDMKLPDAGEYDVQIVDAVGNVVLQHQINADIKRYTGQIQTSSTWSSGIYYLRVFNSKNKMVSTSSILVQ